MAASNNPKKVAVSVLALGVVGSLAAAWIAPVQAAQIADPAFTQVWNRTDLPVQKSIVNRSWLWGPEGFFATYEPYMQGPGGQHLVQYFDKSRMEINNPAGDRNSEWFVTNGLLVVDMISGKIQSGDQQFIQSYPANLPVAGDADAYPDTPTYASLARVATLDGNNRAANRMGQSIREGLGPTGGIATLDNLAQYAKYGVYETTLGHNIPDVFWTFMNQQGPIYQNGQYVNGPLMNWLYVMGYPIMEPFWIRIKADGKERWVLMQAFQRRILTYSPFNDPGWRVEMGNVGRAYYDWRYRLPAPAPTATPQPAASMTLDPSKGDATTPVQVNGRGFPAYAAVTVSVEKASANYSRNLATVAVNADGSFGVSINIPVEAAKLGELTIRASANGGAVQATQIYTVKAIFTDYTEVVTYGDLHVYGVGQPSGQTVRIGVQIGDDPRAVNWVGTAQVAGDRSFNTTVNIGNVAPATIIRMVVQDNDGNRATSKPLRVITLPRLSVNPTSGPVNRTVTLRGTYWPKQRALKIGKRSADGQSDVWLPGQFLTDTSGNISVQVNIGNEYATKPTVRLIAMDPSNGVRIEAVYTVSR
jgi:hypothetical protein